MSLAILLAGVGWPAMAAEPRGESVAVNTDGQAVAVTFYRAPVKARAAIIVLHGRSEFEAFQQAYVHYAELLIAAGMDAYFVSYYDASDRIAMREPNAAVRATYFSGHVAHWAQLASDVAADIRRRDPAQKIGLLGFSNGGTIAVATAANMPNISALVVFYGSLPFQVGRLPPLLVLHGAADTTIPVSEGTRLVNTARRIGTQAELVIYPGEAHGFDFNLSNTHAAEASQRAVSFLATELLPRWLIFNAGWRLNPTGLGRSCFCDDHRHSRCRHQLFRHPQNVLGSGDRGSFQECGHVVRRCY